MRYVLAAVVIAIGVAAVIAGGADDAPGLQLLGMLLVIGAIATSAKKAFTR